MLPASLGAPKGALPLYQSSTLHCRVYTGCSCSILRRVSYTASTTMHCTVGPKAYTGPLFCLSNTQHCPSSHYQSLYCSILPLLLPSMGFQWFCHLSTSYFHRLGAPSAILPILHSVHWLLYYPYCLRSLNGPTW